MIPARLYTPSPQLIFSETGISKSWPVALKHTTWPERHLRLAVRSLQSDHNEANEDLQKLAQSLFMDEIADLSRAGIIRPSSSPFAAPVLFVMKKERSAQLCVDYRALSKLMIKNKFPMPRMEYNLERLDGVNFFTKTDLKSGYHQIQIFEANVPKTAFRTERGHYQFVVIFFGVTEASGSFNKNMSCALQYLLGSVSSSS
ncbi:hypothetical protein L7F22_018367 [Adiantum nelumboides]|nr:hypothetical protein [Adiantum nelumboides]